MDSKLSPYESLASTSGNQEEPSSFPGQPKKFSLDEIRDITDNFSDENILGKGGFGVVYKGTLPKGSLVAIKRLLKERSTPEGLIQFQREVEMISLAVHKNLLRLLGFCITSEERLLVYPFIVNGSVASCLKGRRSGSKPLLDWGTRKRIIYGTAMALSYLHDHCRPKIIHRDIKPDNILLDENFEAVVADFGLARLIHHSDSHVTTDVCGTIGHIAPEYYASGVCSEKTDVYSYGVFLLEILSGKRVWNIVPSSRKEEIVLFDWIKKIIKNGKGKMLVDSELQGNFASREAAELVQLALLCTHRSPKERPEMSKVVRMLEDRSLVEKGKWRKPSTKGFLTQINSFSFSQLQAATNFFGHENIVGRGSFGNVYKAKLKDNSQVLVKRLKNCTQNGELQYQAEILVMKYKMKHPNLLQLLGFCTSGQERLIVYPFYEKGNVASYLGACSKSSKLDLKMKKKIALGVAKGLAYLHDGCNVSIIHGDVKAENILLDENFNAVVGDYGLCHFVDCDEFPPITDVRGTLGYIAPEYISSKIPSKETDVFAYGIFLLELLTGHKPSDLFALSFDHQSKHFAEECSIVNLIRLCLRYVGYIQLNDCGLLECDVKADTTEQLLQLALLCTQAGPWKRPTMSRIVQILEDDGWERVNSWRNVMKLVQCEWNAPCVLEKIEKMSKGINCKGKQIQTVHDEWIEAPLFMRKLTLDEKERISHLKHLLQKFSLYEWQRGPDPKMDVFPYLSEENMSIYAMEGAIPILGRQYKDWFGKRFVY